MDNSKRKEQLEQELHKICFALVNEFGAQEANSILARYMCANQASYNIINNLPDAGFTLTHKVKGKSYTTLTARTESLALIIAQANQPQHENLKNLYN